MPTSSRSSFETWSSALDAKQLTAQYGSPLYVTSKAQLLSNLGELSRLVGQPGRVAYPVKANPAPEVLDTLAKAGAGADCASALEVRRALACGVPADKILYNSPSADPGVMAAVYVAGGTVVVDSAASFAQLQEAAPPGKGKVLLRLSLAAPKGHEEAAGWKALMAHANPTGKFGIPQEECLGILEAARLPVDGLHLHVGTLMDNLEAFEHALGTLHALARDWREQTRHPLCTLNLGGGLGVVFEDGQGFPSRKAYVEKLQALFSDEFDYIIEPGNALVADASVLLTTVTGVKNMRGKTWAICDVGSDQILRATVTGWRSRILHNNEPLASSGTDAVAGPLCFAGDVLLPQTNLTNVRVGDVLSIQHVGAYTYAISNHFNGRLGPTHLLVEESGELSLAMQKEDDFFELSNVHQRLNGGLSNEAASWEHLSAQRLNALSSAYLRTTIQQDSYRVTAAKKRGEFYEYTLAAESPLGAVSLPFALRVVADLGIVALLDYLNKDSKDFPVWANRAAVFADRIVSTKRAVTLRIWIGPNQSLPGSAPEHDVRFEFNKGAFSGVCRAVY